jgi:Fe-S-cluster-containing hydrogenase component 2
MIAHYGFKDGSGDWYLIIDTDKCNGCSRCVEVCPAKALEVGPDEMDMFRKEPVASLKQGERKKIRYTCAPCKPGGGEEPAPCAAACETKAISHSDGWKKLYQGLRY